MPLATNPQYQRAVQRARARAPYGNRPDLDALSAAFAAKRQQHLLEFSRLGIRGMMMKEHLRQQDRAISEEHVKRRDIQRATSQRGTALALGLGTSIFAAAEGRRRKRILEGQAEQQKAVNEGIISAIGRLN